MYLDSFTSDAEESFYDSSEDDSSSARSEGTQVVKTKRRGFDARQAVIPPPFELDGKVYLKDYLH